VQYYYYYYYYYCRATTKAPPRTATLFLLFGFCVAQHVRFRHVLIYCIQTGVANSARVMQIGKGEMVNKLRQQLLIRSCYARVYYNL